MTAEIIFDDELENLFDDVASLQAEYIDYLIDSDDWYRAGQLRLLEYLLEKEYRYLLEVTTPNADQLRAETQARLVVSNLRFEDIYVQKCSWPNDVELDEILQDSLNDLREIYDRIIYEREITEYCKTIVK